jgi:hypothetical protein
VWKTSQATASLDDLTEAKSQVWKDVHRWPFGMDRGLGRLELLEHDGACFWMA